MMRDIIKYSYPCLKTTVDLINHTLTSKSSPSLHLASIDTLLFREANCKQVTSQNEKTTLLGKTKQDYASILQWMSFVNTEVLPPAIGYFLGPLGRIPFNKRAGEESLEKFYKAVDVIEKHLLINTFLVGERLTLADLFAAGLMQRAFQFILDKKWRAANPNTTRWFETVTNQPMYSDVCPEIVLCDEPIKNVPPAKPEQPKKEKAPAAATAPKAASKPKEAEADEEEEDRPAPKAKHPLESLGKPTLVLDDWKRKYSNEETREVALPWFWENFKSDEYSLWKIDYKYNDELTMTFMTSNLIGASYYSALRGRLLLPSLLFSFSKARANTLASRGFLRPSRSFAQVHIRLRLRLWPTERQHRAGRLRRPRAGGTASLRCGAGLRVV